MGSGASVLQDTPINRSFRGGLYGYTVDFPPGHWVWDPVTPSSASASTATPPTEEEVLEEEED